MKITLYITLMLLQAAIACGTVLTILAISDRNWIEGLLMSMITITGFLLASRIAKDLLPYPTHPPIE